MKFRPPKRRHLVQLQLTPMIDVVFLLIIFFMTTAQFVQQQRVRLELPEQTGEPAQRAASAPLVVNVLHEGEARFIVGEKRMNSDQLLTLIDGEIARAVEDGGSVGDVELTVRADRRASSAALNELARSLRERGVRRWRLAVELP